jgi:amidase
MRHTPFGRRDFLQLGAAAAATPALVGATRAPAWATSAPGRDVEEATIAQLQADMAAGRRSALRLTRTYLGRIRDIDRRGPKLNSVIEVNPDAEKIARALDDERRAGTVRGPLHGIPILLKDNIDTADRMKTTAGSLGLVGPAPAADATVVALLREAGVVILGKSNLSEWANFRSFHSASGWSGRGGLTKNPYVLDRNPCGSSSGSGAAVSANLCAAAVGTETDGSIVCPATANGVVGIKPTVGLTSRTGVVPIAHSQDSVGPHGRTVADAAALLSGMVSPDANPHDYTQFVAADGLRGARIGVARDGVTGYSEETDAVFDAAVAAMRDAGAVIVDPADIPTIAQINAGSEEVTVLVYEFKRDLDAYLATRTGVPIGSLADAIAFNQDHADEEMRWFRQEWFELAQSDPFSQADYEAALAEARRIGGADGIDAVLQQHDLDAIVAPTGSPPWTTDLVNGDHFLGASSAPAAIAGYPLVNVPAGEAFGLPLGITFMGTANSEPTLIRVASGFEAATHARRTPKFLPTLATS